METLRSVPVSLPLRLFLREWKLQKDCSRMQAPPARTLKKSNVRGDQSACLFASLNGVGQMNGFEKPKDEDITEEQEVQSMEKESRSLLEWEDVCRQVSCFCSTTLGVKEIQSEGLYLASSIEETDRLLAQTQETLKVDLDFKGVFDIVPGLEQLKENPRVVFTALQLCGIASTIKNAFELEENLRSYPILYKVIQPATLVNSSLLKDLQKSLREGDGYILDEASKDLKSRREERKENQEELQRSLKDWAQRLHKEGACERPIVVSRRDRQCIPVKKGRQGQLPKGSVRLSQSASGSTVYMEPEPVVELNNKAALLHTQIRHHERRILTKLTQMVLEEREALEEMMKALTELDVIYAKGRHVEWIGGVKPKFLLKGRDDYQVHIPDAFHPLLLEQYLRDSLPKPPSMTEMTFSEDFQPAINSLLTPSVNEEVLTAAKTPPQALDLLIPSSKTVVALTGPNTGGKTASLKTLGLCVLMAKAGLYIPLKTPSGEVYLKWFDKVLADIGDSQSLQQSLSTFSGHLRRLNKILDEVCDNSLVLLDEIGTGTDPTEGAALASSILCELSGIAGLTVATTHHAEIKELADNDPLFLNASMEFNTETLKPTYRLVWGSMGQSNALDICTALKFDSKVVYEARKWLEKGILQSKKESKLENSLRQKLQETHSQREALEEAKKETQKKFEILNEQLRLMKVKETSLLEKLTKYNEVVQEVDSEVDWILGEAKNNRLSFKEAENCLQELKDRGLKLDPAASGTQPTWYPEFNEIVQVKTIPGAYGTVLSKTPGRMVQVKCRAMTFEVPIWDVEKVSPEDVPKQQQFMKKMKSVEKTDTPIGYKEFRSDRFPTSYNTIDLRGLYVEDAIDALDRELQSKLDASVFFVIHGKGTGKLKTAVKEYLKQSKVIKSIEDDPESGGGCTIVTLWT